MDIEEATTYVGTVDSEPLADISTMVFVEPFAQTVVNVVNLRRGVCRARILEL